MLLSGCSKSYQSQSYCGVHDSSTVSEDVSERRFLFNRAELCADVFLRIAHIAPASLVNHLSYLDSVMDFPDALYPLVLHRLAYAIALTIVASPAASSHANRLCNELTKLLTMGNTAGKKTALIVASHLIRAASTRCASGVECGWVDVLMRRSVAVLASCARAVVESVSGAAVGVSMLNLSSGGELMSDGVYVLDGEWNVMCVALDGLGSLASYLPPASLESAATTIESAMADLAVLSFDVPTSSPSHPCVLFSHQLPDSLLSNLPKILSPFAASTLPILHVHSFYLSVMQRSSFSPLRLSLLPLLFRSHLACLSASAAGTSTSLADAADEPLSNVAAFLQCGYELPAAAASDALPADPQLLLDTGLCAVISYQCCQAAIEAATRSSPSPALSRPLLTALSTLLHLLDLVVECDKQLRARAREWREQQQQNSVEAGMPNWLSSAYVFHDAVASLPPPDSLLLTTTLQFCLSSPPLPVAADSSSPSSSASSSASSSLLRRLYQIAYRPAATIATAGLFTDTGFFSLLHIALRSIQLLMAQHRADPFVSHSSSIFLPAHMAVRDSLHFASASSCGPLSSFSSSFSSSSRPPITSPFSAVASSSAPLSSTPWSLLSPALSSLQSRCAAFGLLVLPLDTLLLRDGCLPVLFASLEELCSLEQDNRKEPYIAPPSTTKRARKRPTAPSSAGASVAVAAQTSVAPLSGKEEQEEVDELVTPFQRRKRGRRKLQHSSADAQPVEPAVQPMVLEEGPAATVSFVLPDQSSQLVVADCLSLLSSYVCHILSLAITRCLERQALDERVWTLTWQALVTELMRSKQSTALASSSPSSQVSSPIQSVFNHLIALALRHTCSSTSLAGWSLARVLHSLDGSLAVPSGLVQQLLSVYPQNQLLATSVALHLLPLPTSTAVSPPASLFLSNLSIRSPQLLRLFDAGVRAFVAHCARHATQPTAADREGGWADLAMPVQSSKLAGGLHGDDWTLHWLAWQYCETADTAHVERVVEWMLQCMYELTEGQTDDAEEEETDQLKHRVALTGHPVLATLTAGSFVSYLQLLLLLAQLQLARLQPHTARPPPYSFAAGLHRALLTYCHLLQIYLLAADISLPQQRQRLSLNQPSSSPLSFAKQPKRGRSSSTRSQCHPLSVSDPSCSVSIAVLSSAHSAVLSSFVFVSRVLRMHLPVAVSGEVRSATAGSLHSAELLETVNLALYASEQAEVVNLHAPVVALLARTSRKRESGAAAGTSATASSTSLHLLKSVELLRASVESLMTPYGYTSQSSHDLAIDNGSVAAEVSQSPLPALPHHTIEELSCTEHTGEGAAAVIELEEEQSDDEEEEDSEGWSDEGSESDEGTTAGPRRSVSRFHQRMDDQQPSAAAHPRVRTEHSTHSRRPHHTLFDSTDDDDDDEEYVAEQHDEQAVDSAEVELDEKERDDEATLQSLPRFDDDDIESGKDEAEDEHAQQT